MRFDVFPLAGRNSGCNMLEIRTGPWLPLLAIMASCAPVTIDGDVYELPGDLGEFNSD